MDEDMSPTCERSLNWLILSEIFRRDLDSHAIALRLVPPGDLVKSNLMGLILVSKSSVFFRGP